MFRILAFSDLHEDRRALVGLKRLLLHTRYDAILIAGDIVGRTGTALFDELLAAIGETPCVAVPGNMDGDDVKAKLIHAGISVDLRTSMLGDRYQVFGVGGCPKGPFNTPNEYDDEELWNKLKNVKLKRPSIIVSHSPPFGFFDDVGKDVHIGSRSVLKLMQRTEPVLLICGHVHETSGLVRSAKTTIVKLAPAKSGYAAEITISGDNYAVEAGTIKFGF